MKKHFVWFVLFLTLRGQGQVNLSQGLRVCMPFDGNTLDFSGNNNHGTLSGSVTPASDRFNSPNKAKHFNGDLSAFVSIQNFTNITTANELSIAMWAQSDLETSTCLFMLNPDNFNDRCVGCAQYSGVGQIWDYGDITTNGRHTFFTSWNSSWHHYVFVVSQEQKIKQLYMDGTLIISTLYGGSLINKNFPLYIGAGTSSGGGGSLRWRGTIDEVYMYNRAINANEVTALFQGAKPCADNTSATSYENTILLETFYPAISPGNLIFSGNVEDLSAVHVYSCDGRLLKTVRGQELISYRSLDISEFADGIYLLLSNQKQWWSIQKIILQR